MKGKHSKPIGVFDSGLGGLTVVRELRRRLPAEAIVYFGDIARLPYGPKSKVQIRRFSVENTEFLLQKGIKALVVACNSSASAAFGLLNRRYSLPMVSVIEPAVDAALERSSSARIGVIGTAATVESGVYEKALRKKQSKAEVFSVSCPLFVPLVEEGWLDGRVAEQVVEKYLAPLGPKKIDTLILGCTHYPILAEQIRKFMGPGVTLIDSAAPTVKRLAALLERQHLLSPAKGSGKFEVYVSDLPRSFRTVGERFLGEKLPPIKVVELLSKLQ